MTQSPIMAKGFGGGGLLLLAIALIAVALQGLSDWWYLLTPIVITSNGLIWMRHVNKYGTVIPVPKHAAKPRN